MWPQVYFNWLKKSSPTGEVEIYPELSDSYETNLPNVFVIGDLTGVPLLKMATESGVKVWNYIPNFKNDRYDVVIIGSGPSGVSCAIEAKRLGKKYIVLESNLPFQTIQSYPNGKPIFAEPSGYLGSSAIKIVDTTKEGLLKDLNQYLKQNPIQIQTNQRVIHIQKDQIGYTLETESGSQYQTNSVVIAMGKSGDPKKLGIKGEMGSNVLYRFIDPKDTKDQSIVIVGGGDTALESAIMCSEYAKEITLIHRGNEFNKAKSENVKKVLTLSSQGKIKILYDARLTEINQTNVFVQKKDSALKIKSDLVYILIGNLPPLHFFQKIGVKLQNQKNFLDWLGFSSLMGFAFTAYFGKASFYGPFWFSVVASISALYSTLSLILYATISLTKNKQKFDGWKIFKVTYFLFVFLYFLSVYFLATYQQFQLFGKYPSFHYTLLYSLTILIFGIRRMMVRKTQYIFYQTLSLIGIQIFFLFLLPELILPKLGDLGYLGTPEGFIRTEIFPSDAYWKAYGFILAWPLSMGVLYDGGITNFWLVYGLSFSFVFIPLLVYHYGKGVYCGWICSCGGLAETLGDEYRQKMPHSKTAYGWEHTGQYILFLAFLLTFLKLLSVYGKTLFPFLTLGEMIADSIKLYYDIFVDIGLAGVVGVGCYFLYSGRVWCRMFCPLASLMHIYARFSKFRIFSEKKKCISCNICTKNCHQGIDVMGYASRGIPMDSVQCVRCSACVSLCPTDVLSFGKLNGNQIDFDLLDAKTRK
ncbi:pyridine nucleotide-disulfide oxidoreductase [Leptospira levettii]|uniref:NAD(P)-binding domain-containing protein n=1 Tax=Leptospira levettii TaxID=2023178 RepID=UPI000C2AB58E|nr:NAD(P)-binding domain-containing protein [Leptospira levettii]PJZ87742.1 pyridine nucleotide-disulfide oxidoreductase [Leptospira levettii]PJZ99261.1 pyridine nucleotide-disulfide oxidoreductase [Leptospira levettii]